MKLHEYPAAIEAAQLEILSLSERITYLKDIIADSDNRKMAEILEARTTENKPQFTNDLQRNIELRKLQNADPLHKQFSQEITELESLRAKKQFALGRLQNEFAVAKLDKREQIISGETTTENTYDESWYAYKELKASKQ